MRDVIQSDPEYQRSSDVWTREKQQLLIDTILNGFDVPKLYFHKFPSSYDIGGKSFEYAIIDGKQRLEAMWGFIEGKFSLSTDFDCLWDPTLAAGGMTYADLSKNFPDLKTALDSFPLTIVCIETNDIEIIEDLFSRLNEAVPLSAAEKRNAKGGPIPVATKSLCTDLFFQEKLPFGNSRYRHFDLAVKFILTSELGKVSDTKKSVLDRYVEVWAGSNERTANVPALDSARKVLTAMSAVFTNKDRLLRQIGSVILYFHLFRIALEGGWANEIQRFKLESFDKERIANKVKAENGEDARIDLLEFDRYAQSTNDAYAIKLRLQILLKLVFNRDVPIEAL